MISTDYPRDHRMKSGSPKLASPTTMDHHGGCGGFECGFPTNPDFKKFSEGFGEEASRRFQHRFEGSRIGAKLVDDTAFFHTAQSGS